MSDNIHWPAMLPRNPLKRRIKVWVGQVFGLLMPARRQRVQTGQLQSSPDFIDRQISMAWADSCLRTGNPEALAPLHQQIWRDDNSALHHEATAERFWDWWNAGHKDILPAIAQVLESRPGAFNAVCEIGCGQALAFPEIHDALPGIERLIGLDLSAAQTEQNKQRHADKPWEFVHADVLEWLPAEACSGTVFMTIGGVFEYFTQAQVSSLLRTVAEQKAPAVFACIEPIAHDFDLAAETNSRPFPPENTYAHNYPKLMEAAGFKVAFVAQRTILHRWLLTVASC